MAKQESPRLPGMPLKELSGLNGRQSSATEGKMGVDSKTALVTSDAKPPELPRDDPANKSFMWMLLDVDGDGEVNFYDLLAAPLKCFSALDFLLGVGYSAVPGGAIVGTAVLAIGLVLNFDGFERLVTGFERFGLSRPPEFALLQTAYVVTFALGVGIVIHGILVGSKSLERLVDEEDEEEKLGDGADAVVAQSEQVLQKKPRSGGPCLGRCCQKILGRLQCCVRSGFQISMATLGTLVIIATFLIFLLEITGGVVLFGVFEGIEKSCDLAIPQAGTLVNNTAADVFDWYETSGVKAGAEAASGPPLRLGLDTALTDTVRDISNTATSYVDAVKTVCALFDGLSYGAFLIAVGSFVAVIAQVITLVFHVKYYTVWWYETKLALSDAARHQDDAEPEYTNDKVSRALDNVGRREKVEQRLQQMNNRMPQRKAMQVRRRKLIAASRRASAAASAAHSKVERGAPVEAKRGEAIA